MNNQEQFQEKFAEIIRMGRAKKNMLQKDLARQLKVSDNFMRKVERGETTPKTYLAFRMLYLLGIDPRIIQAHVGDHEEFIPDDKTIMELF